jgi:hypothetical protein
VIYPALKVEIAFENDPYVSSPTWTDVTKYVRGEVTVKRGRNYELNKNDAGTASLTLENTDGRFDPLNTSSPYAPYVLPYRQVRITAFDGATTYNIFRGYVERFPQQWAEGGNYGTVDVTAVDGTKTALAKTFGLRYFEQVTTDLPVWYWRYDSTLGRTVNSGTSTGNTSSWVSTDANVTQTFLDSSGPSNGDSAVRAAWTGASNKPDDTNAGSSASYMNDLSGGGYGSSSPGTVVVEEVWWKPESIPTTSGQFIKVIGRHVWTAATSASQSEISVEAQFAPGGATYQLRYWGNTNPLGSGVVIAGATTVRPTAGRWDHIAVRQTYTSATSKTYELYVNGVLLCSGTQSTNVYPAFSSGALGGAYNLPSGFACQWAEYATYSNASSPAGNSSVAGIQNRATYQNTYAEYASQTSGARVSAVLDTLGWPSALRSIEAGASTLQATGSLSGKTANDVIQAAALDELGNVFLDAAGRVVFHNRAHRNGATSVLTFGEGPGEVPYLEGVTVDFDDQYVSNRVEVTQSGVTPSYVATSFDATSQGVYGLRTLSRSTAVSNASDADGQAATLLARYKQPVARLGSVPVEVRANSTPGVIASVLSREIGELVTAKRRPLGAPVITLDVFIDGVEDRISAESWVRTFLTTPKYANSTY